MSRPVLNDAERADGFRGVAHPTRRKIIRLLGQEGEMSVAQLLAKVDVTPQAMSAHLAVLRETGLVNHTAAGPNRRYRVSVPAIRKLARWLEQSV